MLCGLRDLRTRAGTLGNCAMWPNNPTPYFRLLKLTRLKRNVKKRGLRWNIKCGNRWFRPDSAGLSGATHGDLYSHRLAVTDDAYINDALWQGATHPGKEFIAGSNRDLVKISDDVADLDPEEISRSV